MKDLTVGSVVNTKLGEGVIRKIGEPSRGDRGGYAWVMLTLDLNGQVAYCAAREDEPAQSD